MRCSTLGPIPASALLGHEILDSSFPPTAALASMGYIRYVRSMSQRMTGFAFGKQTGQ